MYRAKTNIWKMNYTDNYEKINEYVENKKIKMSNINKSYNQIKDVLKKFIDITKDYSDNIISIAMTLLPNSDSIEGKLIQAIQGIFLFNSENLNILINDVSKILKAFKANKQSNSSGLDDFFRLYNSNFSNVVKNYCNYISENELYEKYLIHKELGILNKNIENKNEYKQNEYKDEFIVVENGIGNNSNKKTENINNKKGKEKGKKKEKKKSKTKQNNIKEEEKKVEENKVEENKIILKDNFENILNIKKDYLNSVKEINVLIKKLIEFGWNEERLLKTDFYNNCKNFVDKLLEYLENQKKKYEDQSALIKVLNEVIKSEKIENLYLEPQIYSLHCLSIYMNKRAYLTSKQAPNTKLKKNEFDNDLYFNLNIENIENIIKEMQKNNIEIKKEDLENFEKEKNIALIEKNTKLIFESSSDLDFSDEDLNKMIEYFKNDKENILFFLQKLNNDRSRGGLISSMKIFKRIGELFKLINDLILEKNDLDCFKYIAILSMTYYINSDNNEKIYIYEYIKNHPSFKKMDFWEKYLETLIKYDLNNNTYNNNDEFEKEDEKQFKLSFATFSNILSVINNMTDFGLEKEFIKKFVDFAKNNYSLKEDQKVQIDGLLDIYNEKGTNDQILKKQIDKYKIISDNNNEEQNKINNINNEILNKEEKNINLNNDDNNNVNNNDNTIQNEENKDKYENKEDNNENENEIEKEKKDNNFEEFNNERKNEKENKNEDKINEDKINEVSINEKE